MYPIVVDEILVNSGGISRGPILAHQEMKYILTSAPLVVTQRLKDADVILKAYKRAKRQKHVRYLQLRQIPQLLQFFHNYSYNYEDLHVFLPSNIVLQAERHIDKYHSEPATQISTAGLNRWLRLWSVKSKRFGATTILPKEGEVPMSQKQSVQDLIVQ